MSAARKKHAVDFDQLAYIGVGSNLGKARENVLNAIDYLAEFSDEPLLKSSLWDTTPVDCPPGSPRFVNAVIALVPRPDETPEKLLIELQALEKEFGRRPKRLHNEARPLDLDIIAFGRQTRSVPSLILPHPRAHLRRFVLQPLSEIAPDLILPAQKDTVATLLTHLEPDAEMLRMD